MFFLSAAGEAFSYLGHLRRPKAPVGQSPLRAVIDSAPVRGRLLRRK